MDILSSAAPALPNTQQIAIGVLVADAMSKSNSVNQKQLESQKEIDQQFMEQSIANAIEQIQDNAPSNAVSLAEVKQFLNQMSQDDSTWGADVRSWISGELSTANSYVIHYILPIDVSERFDEEFRQISGCPHFQGFTEREFQEFIEIASNNQLCKMFCERARMTQESFKKFVNKIKCEVNALQNDPATYAAENRDPELVNHLEELASGNNMMHQEANENVTGYNAMLKEMQGFDKSIEGIIAEISAAAQASGAV